jgi:c-di-GMP-related signal transduction protein
VIRNDIDQKADYRLVNEEIWNFFQSRYGGGPKIIRNSIEEKTKYNYCKKIIEVFYRKVFIMFI